MAEDDATNAALAEAVLSAFGCSVRVVRDGDAAARAAQAGRYDLILMDFHMPVMSGLEATRAIRQWEADQATAPVPIVALTGSAMEHETQACLDAGMDDVLVKPFMFPALQAVLSRWTGWQPPTP
ncbi:two-component hybrid sensor and regulator [Caldimonas brevitalea]|uniref:Two-component hybrid sensor and regulator n=1 Tax=Caldimonas brevitalea TaxID=413882 RepID=A0A0G3BQ62_9BURK|nr:two-component hybrid sensor and regulator [Caldimonas brevitalea]